MKRILLLLSLALIVSAVKAQVYDGISQPTKFRLWLPVTTNIEGDRNVTSSPFIGYKLDAQKWLSFTTVLQYNLNTENFSPQIWVNLNYNKQLYFLARSIYDTKTERFRETLSATAKLPLGLMIDATWDNMYNGRKFAEGDRFQMVGGIGVWRIVCNAGYSMRSYSGFIANIRFKITDYNWLQFRYDGGLKNIALNMAIQFN